MTISIDRLSGGVNRTIRIKLAVQSLVRNRCSVTEVLRTKVRPSWSSRSRRCHPSGKQVSCHWCCVICFRFSEKTFSNHILAIFITIHFHLHFSTFVFLKTEIQWLFLRDISLVMTLFWPRDLWKSEPQGSVDMKESNEFHPFLWAKVTTLPSAVQLYNYQFCFVR